MKNKMSKVNQLIKKHGGEEEKKQWADVQTYLQSEIESISIQYNGKYPNLCSGKLIVTINGEPWEFPDHCMVSGGSVWFSNDYSEEHVNSGPWSIDEDEWPEGFPEKWKSRVLEEINDTLEWGCCGGCI